MTGKTHRAGGMLCSIVGFYILRQRGLLLPDVNEGLQWLVMYPFCMWGSVASDLDHHWESSPLKGYPDWIINKLLHLTAPLQKSLDKGLTEGQKKSNALYKFAKLFNASHRSWQTHSDLTLLSMLYLLNIVMSGRIPSFTYIDNAISSLVVTGICMGIIAHFILDMLTPEGVYCIFLVFLHRICKMKVPEKIHFVPKSKVFITGSNWENFVNKVLKFLTVMALVWIILVMLFPLIKDHLPFEIEITNFMSNEI